MAVVTAVHGAGLVAFLVWSPHSDWRMVINGVIWAGLSLGSARVLEAVPRFFFQSLVSQQVEEYVASRSQVRFTRGMCAECFREQKLRQEP